MTKRIIIGTSILLGTVVLIGAMVSLKPEPPKKKPVVQATVVETQVVNKEPIQFIVDSQGPVKPVIDTTLVAEVSGRITKISDKFRVGSFVKKGDVLFEIDSANYIANVRSAEASLAQAKAAYQDAKARTDQARKDWKKIGRGEPTDLVLKIPQLNQAKAGVQSAEAALYRAQQDLERTKVKANFDALIKTKNVGLGQYVNVGSQVATLYGTDTAEVRLPIPDQQLAYLNLPVQNQPNTYPDVRLSGIFAGEEKEWFGKLVRTEGVVEESNRLTYLVAQVSDPYGLKDGANHETALRFGTFVKAEIAGQERENLIKLPRQALYYNKQVLSLVDENKIQLVDVKLARTESNTIYVSEGLENGQEIIITPVQNPVNGMKVKKFATLQAERQKAAEKKAQELAEKNKSESSESSSKQVDSATVSQ
ncbi:efflux RND transporter periplasmic adaptor subunit [Kangiella spongicola]|uniref:Efflux RND transporter periplasmic adaptor subunit n=1 Tax=Kangiella spongicola TaxID=796379 RepID=A0A318D8X0_9GAMM|nr:efflux RND transporter periplasmic adaptor subunit [Kangiella spongicola]PXF62579.1 efflux RND transporter periplasmic adaptor subunit [Kangiella spongicola]